MASNSYNFTEKASEDLDGISHYIANTLSNPTAARNFYQQLLRAIERIWYMPESGGTVINEFLFALNVRRVPIGNYILYYQYDEDNHNVRILRIIYAKRDISEIIKSL